MAKRTEGPSTWCSLTHARALTNTFLGSGPALVLLPACIAGKCLDLIPSSHTLTITTNSTTSARTRGHSMLHSVACLAPPFSKVSRGQASDITPPLLFSPLLFSCPHRRCSFSLIVCASLCLSACVAVWFLLADDFFGSAFSDPFFSSGFGSFGGMGFGGGGVAQTQMFSSSGGMDGECPFPSTRGNTQKGD